MEEIDTGRIATGKMNPGQMRVQAGRAEGIMELKEEDIMAIGGVLEDTARGVQTWGILLQTTL